MLKGSRVVVEQEFPSFPALHTGAPAANAVKDWLPFLALSQQ